MTRECLGCQRLEDQSVSLVALVSGQKVCQYCPEWMLECEARNLLKMPLDKRRHELGEREKVRGKAAADVLRSVMTAVHAAGKAIQ